MLATPARANPYAQPRQSAAPALSRTGRAFALVLIFHAGLFFALHSVMQSTVPAQLIETISAQIVTEFKPPDPVKPAPSPPTQAAPVLPSQAPTPLAQAPSAAPAITAAPTLSAPSVSIPASTPASIPAATPAISASSKPAVVIPASRVDSSCTVPRYPAASERLREEGVVTLRFLISENGQVISGQVDKSSGYKRLDDAALAALSLCKFKPATVDGKPRQDWSALRYRWELKDD